LLSIGFREEISEPAEEGKQEESSKALNNKSLWMCLVWFGPWNSAVEKLQRIALPPADSAGRSITSVEVAGMWHGFCINVQPGMRG
jgi:hypothetical protein